MTLTKVVLDTNIYVDWMNRGRFEHLMLGHGLVRYLSAVVCLELRAGAQMLPARRAVDQLVALSARSIGATVITMDADFRAIADVVAFQVQIVAPE